MRRLVFASALSATLLAAPNAGSVPGDPTPPEITPTIVGTLGSAGWYRSNVTVNWRIVDPESIILGTDCVLATTLITDTPGTRLTCKAWSDGGETSKSVTIKIDRTAPVVSATTERQPDANGWYNHALGVSFHGTDATSGMQGGCSSLRYTGPDSGAAVVTGSCLDVAGNTGVASTSFKYDGTAPTLFAVTAALANRTADIAWRKSADTAFVEVLRAPGLNGQGETVVYRGSETGFRDAGLVVGRKYEYRVAAFDEAANRVESKLELTAKGALLSPAAGAVVTRPPTLVWAPVARASYYNVQLVRGRKVYSAWPTRTSLRLPRTWTYKKRRYALRPGTYRWYVWPGFGRISAGKYGRLLGGSTFVVAG